jgi:Lamin Tail Domain
VTNTALAIGISKANNAGIPLAQPTNAAVSIVAWDYNPVSGNQQEEYVCLTNANDYAVDLTGWRITGGISHTLQPGTVIPARMALYLSPNVVAFQARATAPRGAMGLFVQGDYSGQLSARGDTVTLLNTQGVTNSSISYPGTPSLAQQYLRITEIMYNPAPAPAITNDAQQFEYLELKNVSTNVTLNLAGVRFTNGIAFNFTGSAVTSLAPGQRVLLVHNQAVFTARYGSGMLIAGEYSGALDNGGETLRLEDAVGEKVLEFAYDDGWYPITDGLGFSLVIVDDLAPWSTWGDKASWRASGRLDGSPGAADPAALAVAPVLVNEALTHTDPPELDTIELFNPTATNVNLGGWFLTDDFFSPRKYRIPDGTTIPAGGFLVITTNQFGAGSNGFALSELGEEVYLFSGDAQTNLTGYYHGFDFGAAPNGVSFGRYVDSQQNDHYVLQAANTLGTNNALPRVGPVVISEIMYHPPDLAGGVDNAVDEFIRLKNVAATNVPLWCVFTNEPGYGVAARTNTWRLRNAVDFDFPTNHSLAAGAQLLIVGFDPATNASQVAAFRLTNAVPTNVAIYGPWSGKLDNSEDTLELKCPDKPDVTSSNFIVPYVLVDKVTYHDSAPWPTNADGLGMSLQRRDLAAFGNDPINWKAAMPEGTTAPDTDSDGMPDSWETEHGLVVGINDAALDPDSDGMSNIQEYLAGTNPQDSQSVLRLAATPEASLVLLSFEAQTDLAYTVQFNDELGSTNWQAWQQVPASPTNRTMVLTNVQPLPQQRFFRVVTPPVP